MYDSPVNSIETVYNEIKQKADSDLKDAMFTVLGKRGIDIDEEKLVQAITADRKRYEEAYRRGYEAGRRDEYNKFATICSRAIDDMCGL